MRECPTPKSDTDSPRQAALIAVRSDGREAGVAAGDLAEARASLRGAFLLRDMIAELAEHAKKQ